jgi:glucokinase
VCDFPRLTDAVDKFLNGHCNYSSIASAVLAVAGPVDGGRCASLGTCCRAPPP